jgi:acyl-CoA oxidase
MGHATVLRDGTYSASPGHLVLSYSTMLYGRIAVARTTGFQLAQATTIAIRYSTVREQGVPNDGSSPVEIPIMRYKSQHFRLLTLLAKSYAIVFASRKCDEDYATLRSRQETGDHAMLPYMHCLSAGLKAWATQEASDGAEDARKCCGGHGLLAISGLPEIVGSATAAATFEGENYVLWQQVGRYLVKCVDTVKSGKILPPNMAYLGHDEEPLCVTRDEELLDPEVQIAIYRQRARSLVLSVHATLRSSSKSPAEAWNECMMAIIAAARAHIEYTILLSFSTHLSTNLPATTTSALRLALERLRSLFALSHIVNPKTVDAQSFLASSPALLRAVQSGALMRLVNALLDHLLPDAIALTDAWDFTDASLCSALGMRDGDVYTHVMRWVEQLPINRKAWDSDGGVFKPGWKEDVEPVLARARL